eukprot:tig00020830_g14433.t1
MGVEAEAGKLQRPDFWAERLREIQIEIDPPIFALRAEDVEECGPSGVPQRRKRERRRSVHWGLPSIAEALDDGSVPRPRRASSSLTIGRPLKPALRSGSSPEQAPEPLGSLSVPSLPGRRLPSISSACTPAGPLEAPAGCGPRRPSAGAAPVRAPTTGVPTPRRPRTPARLPTVRAPAADGSAGVAGVPSPTAPSTVTRCRAVAARPAACGGMDATCSEPSALEVAGLAGALLVDLGLDPSSSTRPPPRAPRPRPGPARPPRSPPPGSPPSPLLPTAAPRCLSGSGSPRGAGAAWPLLELELELAGAPACPPRPRPPLEARGGPLHSPSPRRSSLQPHSPTAPAGSATPQASPSSGANPARRPMASPGASPDFKFTALALQIRS